jgi:hypothetical protein
MKKIMFFFGLIISNPFSGSKNDEIIGQSDVINSSIKHKNINWKNMIYGTVSIVGIGIIIAVIWRAFSGKSGDGKGKTRDQQEINMMGTMAIPNPMDPNIEFNEKINTIKSLYTIYNTKVDTMSTRMKDYLTISKNNYFFIFYKLSRIMIENNSIKIFNENFKLEDKDLKDQDLKDKDFVIEATEEYKIFKNFADNILNIVKLEIDNFNRKFNPIENNNQWIVLSFNDPKNQETINNILDNLINAVSAFNQLNELPQTQ